MTRATRIDHEFVEFIPQELTPATLYISIPYAIAVHTCLCGCSNRVVTPLSPTDWRLIFDGESTSLEPSIGNWSFPCRSHYWVERNRVTWAEPWSQSMIEAGRLRDRQAKARSFGESVIGGEGAVSTPGGGARVRRKMRRWIGLLSPRGRTRSSARAREQAKA